MILLVFIYLAISYSNVNANENNGGYVETHNGDMKNDLITIFKNYMNYNDAKLALNYILKSLSNIDNVSSNEASTKEPVKTTNTYLNHMTEDNFDNDSQYKTDENPDDKASVDRERRDAPVTKSLERQQKIQTTAGYTHNSDICKRYNKNLRALWNTLDRYMKFNDTIPHKMHLHNIALIIKAYLKHKHKNITKEKPKTEKPVTPEPIREDENSLNGIIEDIRNNIPIHRNGDVVREIVDLVLTKLKPIEDSIFSCHAIDGESLRDIIDLAYQKYLEDVDCRRGTHDIVVDLTRLARDPLNTLRKMFLPYSQRALPNHKILRKQKKNIWADNDDYRRKHKISKSLPETTFLNEMQKLYEEENKISSSVRDCENLALKTFVNTVRSILKRFIKRSECGPNMRSQVTLKNENSEVAFESGHHQLTPEKIAVNRDETNSLNDNKQNNEEKVTPNNVVKYVYGNKTRHKEDENIDNNNFRIPVSVKNFKTDNVVPVHKMRTNLHQFYNRDSENNQYGTNNTEKATAESNPKNILMSPDISHINSKTHTESEDNFTDKHYKDFVAHNGAKGSSGFISQETLNAIPFHTWPGAIVDKKTPEFAELTYVIRDPQVIMYQPQYLVKHRLPYEIYRRNKNLLNKKSSNGRIQLLKAVKLLPSGSKLLYQSKNSMRPIRYSEKVSRKVLDIAKQDIINSVNKTEVPKNISSQVFENDSVLTNSKSFGVNNNKANESNIFELDYSETDYIDDFQTADYVETKSEEFFIDDDYEAMKNKSNLQSPVDVIGKEIHTNGRGKILWNNYPIKRPKYTYNGEIIMESKNQMKR